MFTKKKNMYFIILFAPMLVVSALLNVTYSLQVHDYVQINWPVVIITAVVLDAFITWIQTRKDKVTKSE